MTIELGGKTEKTLSPPNVYLGEFGKVPKTEKQTDDLLEGRMMTCQSAWQVSGGGKNSGSVALGAALTTLAGLLH